MKITVKYKIKLKTRFGSVTLTDRLAIKINVSPNANNLTNELKLKRGETYNECEKWFYLKDNNNHR